MKKPTNKHQKHDIYWRVNRKVITHGSQNRASE